MIQPQTQAVIAAVQASLQGHDPRIAAEVMRAIREALKPHTGGTRHG